MGIQQSKISAVNIHLPLIFHMGVPFDAVCMDFTFAAAQEYTWPTTDTRSSNPTNPIFELNHVVHGPNMMMMMMMTSGQLTQFRLGAKNHKKMN